MLELIAQFSKIASDDRVTFFASRAVRDRIGVLLTDDTDWEEIPELVTDSYRILVPKKLLGLSLLSGHCAS